MENHPVKYKPVKSNRNAANTDTWKHNWEVMKPFVHFGFKAMAIIGGALISIVKLLPALLEQKENTPKKDNRIIKI